MERKVEEVKVDGITSAILDAFQFVILVATISIIADFSWSMAGVETEQCKILRCLMEQIPTGLFFQFHDKFASMTSLSQVGPNTIFGFGLTNLCKPLDYMIEVLQSGVNVVAFSFLTDGDDTVSSSFTLVAKQAQFFETCSQFLSRGSTTLSFALVARGFFANRTIYAIVACLKLLQALDVFLLGGEHLTLETQFVVTDAVECTLPVGNASCLLPSGNILSLFRALKEQLARLTPDFQERILSRALSFCNTVPIIEEGGGNERKKQSLQLEEAVKKIIRQEAETPVVVRTSSLIRDTITATLSNRPIPRQQTTPTQYQPPYVSDDHVEAELTRIANPEYKFLGGSLQELARTLFTNGNVWYMSGGQLFEAHRDIPPGVFAMYGFVHDFRALSQVARIKVISALYPQKPTNREVTEQLLEMLVNPTTPSGNVLIFLEWWASLTEFYYSARTASAVRSDISAIQGTKQLFADKDKLYDLLQMVAICLFPVNGYAIMPNDWYAFLLAFSRFTVDLDLANYRKEPMWSGKFLLATSVDPIKLMRVILEMNRHQVGDHIAQLLDVHLDKTCGGDDIKRARTVFSLLNINTPRELSLFLVKILKGFKRKTIENPKKMQGFIKTLMEAVFFVPGKAARTLRDIIVGCGTYGSPRGVDIPTMYVTPTLVAGLIAPPMTAQGWGDPSATKLILGETSNATELLKDAVKIALENNSAAQSDTFPFQKNQPDQTLVQIFDQKISETCDVFRGYYVIDGDYVLWYIAPRTMDPRVIKLARSPTWEILLPMAEVTSLIALCTPSDHTRLNDDELWERVKVFGCFSQLFRNWEDGANRTDCDTMPPMGIFEDTNVQIGNIMKFCMWLRTNM